MSISRKISENWVRWILGWIPFWICNAIVFQGAVLREEDIPGILLQINDKIIHGTEYAVLFFFSVNAFRRAKGFWLTSHPRYFALGWCLGMGILTEWIQYFVPTRTMDLTDWVANGVGACLALGIDALHEAEKNDMHAKFQMRWGA